ncbi:unnamed protein product, partial [Didymodactylos carnosus]
MTRNLNLNQKDSSTEDNETFHDVKNDLDGDDGGFDNAVKVLISKTKEKHSKGAGQKFHSELTDGATQTLTLIKNKIHQKLPTLILRLKNHSHHSDNDEEMIDLKEQEIKQILDEIKKDFST